MTFNLKAQGAKWSQLPQWRWSEREVPRIPGCFPKLALEGAASPGSGCCCGCSAASPRQKQCYFKDSTARCSIDIPFICPLTQGTLAGMRISGAGGSRLAVSGKGSPATGPPSPQRPPERSPLPSPGGEKKVALGIKKSFSPFLASPGFLAPIHAAGSRCL